ncbi:uncharacterized protein MKZ38_007699 [Zalerion maritima]|uniref:Bicarbonate transporter-like transmembrane domain-containing protein n=1 Tax=Zalerion maritima TaxID=339359 RepID=A0AAD5WP30_9PEZI|nr:uncharacterized protein MKZ38_007699 [Zalerion maritima]
MAGHSSSSTDPSSETLPTTATHANQKGSKGKSHHPSKRGDASSAAGGGVLEQTATHQTHHTHRSHASSKTTGTPKWWRIRLFRGMINDLRRRAPWYWSDWKDAWDYPSGSPHDKCDSHRTKLCILPESGAVLIGAGGVPKRDPSGGLARILPALAFSLDMYTSTDKSYGVNEVLLASVLGSVVFSVFAAQPLVIVGVTGPITVFNYTVFDIMKPKDGGVYEHYLGFMCWIGIWSMIFHWILAVTNSCNWLKFVTRFPCDIFGFYVACIYIQKGIQVLERLHDYNPDDPTDSWLAGKYMSIAVALLVFIFSYAVGELGRSNLFHYHVRIFLKDYGTPIFLVFFTGFAYMGPLKDLHFERLEITKAFQPTSLELHPENWLVEFWKIPTKDIFVAIPFAILLTILFWFDHNVSSLIAQGTEFPLKKPAGFHWDLFLLGLTTGVAGIIGLPMPNGLIPQAPFHTESLCVTEAIMDDDEKSDNYGKVEFKPVKVVEQRVSNLAQGLLTLGTMSGPLLTVLHLVPHGVLAGLFFIMGFQALESNGITVKILYLLRDKGLTLSSDPLKAISNKSISLFVAIELIGFGATFAITQTIAAVGFPVFIFILIPIRALLLPNWFTKKQLGLLDEATASDFTMESCGGTYGNEVIDGEGSSSGSGTDNEGEGYVTRSSSTNVSNDHASQRSNGRAAKTDVELAEEGQSTNILHRRPSRA